MYSRRPFHEAVDRRCSDEVAVAHYEWLKSGLERNGVEASVYNIALAWNAGISAVVEGRAPGSSHDYAARVFNLANDLHVHQAVSPTKTPPLPAGGFSGGVPSLWPAESRDMPVLAQIGK